MNSEFKTNFEEISLDRLAHLKHKKYFELKDIREEFKNAKMFIIKGKKNIGKSYAMINEMKNIATSGGKFLFLRLTDGEVKSLSKEWTNDLTIPFSIKSNRIFYDNKDCGIIANANNLQSLRSLQYNNYKAIFFDEFVAFDRKYYKPDKLSVARNFIRLVIDVQRAKKSIEIWCFGNNDEQIDLFTNFFKVSINSDINYDKNAEAVIINLRNLYNGIKISQGTKLAYYDRELDNYLKDNRTMKDISLLSAYLPKEQALVRYAFVLNKQYYLFIQKINIHKENGVEYAELSKDFQITQAQKQEVSGYKLLAFRHNDNVRNKESIMLSDNQINAIIQSWYVLIKIKKLTFTSDDTEHNILMNLINYVKF